MLIQINIIINTLILINILINLIQIIISKLIYFNKKIIFKIKFFYLI